MDGYSRVTAAWDKLFRRLQGAAPERGQSVITIRVFTSNGVPCKWSAPRVVTLEPKSATFLDQMLEALTSDE
jgi:hypothetical protein